MEVMPFYCALDIETATEERGSICQIGAAFFDKYGNRHPESDWETLVRPPNNEYEQEMIEIHGIIPSDTADSPEWGEIVDDFSNLISDMPVVAHNAEFEYEHLSAYMCGSPIPPERLFCSLRLSRIVDIEATGRHKLENSCARNNVVYSADEAHTALHDAIACGEVWAALSRKQGWSMKESFDAMSDLHEYVGTYEWFKENRPPTEKQIVYLLDLLSSKNIDLTPEINGVKASEPVRTAADLDGLSRAEISDYITQAKQASFR